MDVSIFPPAQMYVPLILLLTIISITATVMLSNNSTASTIGELTVAWPLAALAVAFLHIYWICITTAVTYMTSGHFGAGFGLLVHAVILLVITNAGIRLTKNIANNRMENYTK